MKLIGDDMPVGEAEAHAPACGGDGELDGAGASGEAPARGDELDGAVASGVGGEAWPVVDAVGS